jgi:hypothetical protein
VKSTVRSKTAIAPTDGNDTASKVPPGEAAGGARDRGIIIHLIAIGGPTSAGEEKLDETTLRDVAKRTGGGFYRALDRDELAAISRRLDETETRRIETSYRPKTDLCWSRSRPACFRAWRPALSGSSGAAVACRCSGRRPAHERRTSSFHLLRPLWLVLPPPALVLWWSLR